MLGILIDAGVLMFLVAAVNDNDEVDFMKAGIVGIVMSLICGLGMGFMAESFGMPGVIGGLVPVAAIVGLVLRHS